MVTFFPLKTIVIDRNIYVGMMRNFIGPCFWFSVIDTHTDLWSYSSSNYDLYVL